MCPPPATSLWNFNDQHRRSFHTCGQVALSKWTKISGLLVVRRKFIHLERTACPKSGASDGGETNRLSPPCSEGHLLMRAPKKPGSMDSGWSRGPLHRVVLRGEGLLDPPSKEVPLPERATDKGGCFSKIFDFFWWPVFAPRLPARRSRAGKQSIFLVSPLRSAFWLKRGGARIRRQRETDRQRVSERRWRADRDPCSSSSVLLCSSLPFFYLRNSCPLKCSSKFVQSPLHRGTKGFWVRWRTFNKRNPTKTTQIHSKTTSGLNLLSAPLGKGQSSSERIVQRSVWRGYA